MNTLSKVLFAALLVGCGREEVRIDPPEPIVPPVSAAAEPALGARILGLELVKRVAGFGYPVEHLDAAEFVIDDVAIDEVEDNNRIGRGGILGFALCPDYEVYCKAVFRKSAIESQGMKQVVYHETLHLLGFKHEVCDLGQCKGVMGTYADSRFNEMTVNDVSKEYLKSLTWVRPKQPGDQND
jgi:hypothetical protein